MSQNFSSLTYQVNLPNSLDSFENHFFSPVFSTNNNMFWQICLYFDDKTSYYGVYVRPVANLDEIIWGIRSKLSYTLFVKEIRNNQTVDIFTGNFINIPPDKKIKSGNDNLYQI